MMERYINGESTCKIAKDYGISAASVYSRLKRIGCTFRTNKINSKRNFCNDSYFDKIDTHEKAYWLGFIAADGYVSSVCGKRVGITISEKDKFHLEKFKSAIGYTGEIKTYKYHGYKDVLASRILIASDKMYEDLVKYGVVEHKSNIIKPPIIEEKFISSYLLGYYDGDGSIYVSNNTLSIKIIGTKEILDFFISFLLRNHIDCDNKKYIYRHEQDRVCYISFGGNKKVPAILNLLYSGISLDIPLDRKLKIYLNYT